MNVKQRRFYTIAAGGVIVLSIVMSRILAAQKEPPKTEEEKDNSPLVEYMIIEADTVNTALQLTGRLISRDKVDVYAEVTGRLLSTGKPFKEGARFSRGQVLIRMDNSDALLNLIASRANFQSTLTPLLADISTDYPEAFDAWNTYVLDFDPETVLQPLPVVENQKLKNYLVARKIYNQYYNIKSQEVQISKYTVYAPFNGVVHNANVTPGTLVRAGQTIGEFISTESFELELGISLNDISKVEIGDKVYLKSTDVDGEWVGEITRKSQALDKSTQTFKVYVSVQGKDLSEGMFMEAQLGGKNVPGGITLPANLLINNKYVYVINQDSTLSQHNVNVIHEMDDEVIITGIPVGKMILAQAITGAEEGMRVRLK